MGALTRCGAAAGIAATLAALVAFADAGPARAQTGTNSLSAFLTSLWPEAEPAGVTRALFDATFAGVVPDPGVAALTRQQPEFAKPIGAYLGSQVTPERIARGRALAARWRPALDAIAARYQVPPSILVAIWGLETNYGAAPGSKDVIRSMATLAAMEVRPALYRAELIAALVLLQNGDLRRADLRGSWAGAMGMPQFMPSSFAKFAVDGDGDGRRDIWTDVPDALASIANFLSRQGWRPDRLWGFEVRLPHGFDLTKSRAPYAEWRARGVTRADGSGLPADGDGILFFPAGVTGPAFLVTENFEVIKTYNFSDAYVLSVGHLADRMDGGAAIAAPWPADTPMSRTDRIELQSRLVALGYPVDNREGRVSLALRDTIRLAQVRVGLPPDGNPTRALLDALGKL